MVFGLLARLSLSSVDTGARWPIAQAVLRPETRATGRAALDMVVGVVSALAVVLSGLLVDKFDGNVTLINIVAFVVLSIPFLFYFTVDNPWISWKTDLILGVVAGILLSLVQSTAWEDDKSRMLLHGFAMDFSFPLIIIGIRYSLTIDSWLLMLLAGTLITILASAVIVLIDYQSILKEDADPNT